MADGLTGGCGQAVGDAESSVPVIERKLGNSLSGSILRYAHSLQLYDYLLVSLNRERWTRGMTGIGSVINDFYRWLIHIRFEKNSFHRAVAFCISSIRVSFHFFSS